MLKPTTFTALLACSLASAAFAQDVPMDPPEVTPPEAPGTPATPATPEVPAQVTTDDLSDADATIVVYDDLFARWDGTRWFVATEVQLPWESFFRARLNTEFRSRHYQIRTIIACEKDWRRTRRKWEVDCTIEDFGIQAVARNSDDPAKVQRILDEIDESLTGAYLELQVRDDGRVTNIDLEQQQTRNRRESEIAETLRMVMSRVIVGYDMKLRRYHDLTDGFWVEYNSTLMSLPVSPSTAGAGGPSRGTSTLIHKIERVDGWPTVESRGRGQAQTPQSGVDGGVEVTDTFDMSYAGVAVYDDREGFMTERVWALSATPTASSASAVGGQGGSYAHVGRLRILDDENEQPDVGPTRQVAPPGTEHPILPLWMPLEE